MKITQKKKCFIQENNPQNLGLFTSKKQLRFPAALKLLSNQSHNISWGSQQCLMKFYRLLLSTNEVFKRYNLKFWQDVILSSVFMVLTDYPTVYTFLIWFQEKKIGNRLPSCTCQKYFTLKNLTASFKTQHSLVEAEVLFQFITY